MPQIVLTSGTNWIVPVDCVLIDKAECIGAGAPGTAGTPNYGPDLYNGGVGGGSGAYARKNNVPVAPGSSMPITIGINSAATNFASLCVAAGASGQSGGAAASCIGDVVTGGNPGAAGGAPPPPGGVGGSGGNGGSAPFPNGGAGGIGGAGGVQFNPGSPGGAGNRYGGGGGGGGSGGLGPTNAGGVGGAPGQGVIVINYTPQQPSSLNMPMLGI